MNKPNKQTQTFGISMQLQWQCLVGQYLCPRALVPVDDHYLNVVVDFGHLCLVVSIQAHVHQQNRRRDILAVGGILADIEINILFPVDQSIEVDR